MYVCTAIGFNKVIVIVFTLRVKCYIKTSKQDDKFTKKFYIGVRADSIEFKGPVFPILVLLAKLENCKVGS